MSKSNKKTDAVSLKVAVQSYLKAMGIDDKMHEMSVLAKWEELMGEEVALRTESKEIKEKTLYLKIGSSVMRDQLFQSRSVIIKRINEAAGFEMIDNVFMQ